VTTIDQHYSYRFKPLLGQVRMILPRINLCHLDTPNTAAPAA
jgi:hypothetical protein